MDDNCLVDLINKRFDDQNQTLASLKLDMLREIKDLKDQNNQLEDDVNSRFGAVNDRLTRFDRLTWMASGATIVIVGLMKIAEHFVK